MISAPLDLISAHPWRRAAFTTYALSLSFFEAVLLDALVRGGGRRAMQILGSSPGCWGSSLFEQVHGDASPDRGWCLRRI